MYCEQCGAQVAETSTFCTGCGAKMPPSAAQPSPALPVEDKHSGNSEAVAPLPPAPLPAATPVEAKASKASEYKVVHYTPTILKGESFHKAADQLEALINQYSRQGWSYVRIETLRMIERTPANKGCIGIGATPEVTHLLDIYVVVFSRP